MTTPAKVQVDIWSDVACPWCWVGVLRYKQAVAKLSGRAKVTTKFHPFLIDPATKKEGESECRSHCLDLLMTRLKARDTPT